MNKFIKYISIILCTILIFNTVSFCNITSEYNIPVWNENNNSCSLEVDNNMISLESKAGILMEAHTGKVIFEYNSNEKLRPASVTKIMTILLIMEALDNGRIHLEDKVSCSENARNMGGSQIWLDETEQLTVDEMLKAICVVSANDCCVAMAEFIAGSADEFVYLMNEKAKQLGMNNTTFKNCHGLDEEGHLTTAYEISLMSRELMNNHPDITKYTTIWMDSLRDGKSELVNTNKLIRSYDGITGLKTGSTSLALYNVSATATRNGLSLISVIMGGPTSQIRFNEAKRLLDIGFANYSSESLCKKDEIVQSININKGKVNKIDVVYSRDVNALLKKGENKNIESNIILSEVINAPVNKGDKVGEIVYTLNGTEIGRTDIVTYYNVEKIGVADMLASIIGYTFKLGRGGYTVNIDV